MKNFKTFGGCSTALLAAFILTPPAFAQTTVNAPTEQPGRIITDAAPTTGTAPAPHETDPADITAIGGELDGNDDTRATVERYFTTGTTPARPGTATHTYDPDGDDGSESEIEVEVVDVDGVVTLFMATDTGMRGAQIDTINAIIARTNAGSGSYSLDGIAGVTTDGVTTHTAINPKAIAIGASSVVRGDNSVAIGPGAVVKRVDPARPGTATHIYDPDGNGGPMSPSMVEVVDVDGVVTLFMATTTGMRGAQIDTINAIIARTNAGSGSYSLDGVAGARGPGTPINVDSATAIGANSEVQGDNGVAIGAGATVTSDGTGTGGIAIGGGTAGVDANNDGDYTDAGDTAPTIVTAAANEITIGGATHTGDIKIGNVVLQENGVNHIAANRDNINNNRNSIATNKNDIETNTKGIASAIAIAGLATGPGSGLSIGFGSFQSETSIAIGYDNTFGAEQNMTFKAAAASAGSGSTAGSLSMRWAF